MSKEQASNEQPTINANFVQAVLHHNDFAKCRAYIKSKQEAGWSEDKIKRVNRHAMLAVVPKLRYMIADGDLDDFIYNAPAPLCDDTLLTWQKIVTIVLNSHIQLFIMPGRPPAPGPHQGDVGNGYCYDLLVLRDGRPELGYWVGDILDYKILFGQHDGRNDVVVARWSKGNNSIVAVDAAAASLFAREYLSEAGFAFEGRVN